MSGEGDELEMRRSIMNPLIDLLSNNGIDYKLVKHAPVFTVEEWSSRMRLLSMISDAIQTLTESALLLTPRSRISYYYCNNMKSWT